MKWALVLLPFLITPALAWDGTEVGTDDDIHIEGSDVPREGEEIEIYDEDAGQYEDVEVEDVEMQDEGGVTVKVHDDEEDEDRTFIMEEE